MAVSMPLYGERGAGKHTLVDQETYDKCGHLRWHVSDAGYAVRRVRSTDGRRKTVRLHRLVVGAGDDFEVTI